ncbi:hypothetical protein D3C74_340380 [compost metagenome]
MEFRLILSRTTHLNTTMHENGKILTYRQTQIASDQFLDIQIFILAVQITQLLIGYHLTRVLHLERKCTHILCLFAVHHGRDQN